MAHLGSRQEGPTRCGRLSALKHTAASAERSSAVAVFLLEPGDSHRAGRLFKRADRPSYFRSPTPIGVDLRITLDRDGGPKSQLLMMGLPSGRSGPPVIAEPTAK